ncbi:PAS domain S-box protein [Metabacillus sp. HB246100]
MNVKDLKAVEILDRITDGFFALDKEWNFTYINKRAQELLFRSRKNLINKNIWKEFPEAVGLAFYDNYHLSASQQIPVTFDAYFPPLLTWFSVSTYPSKEGLTVFFQDVTMKKEQELKNEQHYQSLFAQHPDAVFSFDLEGRYLSVNKGMEELLGYTKEEFLTLSYTPLVKEDSLEETNHYFQKAVNGMTQHYETKAIHKDGHVIDVSVTNIPIVINKEIVGVYGIAKDITMQKQSEEMLIRSEKLSVVGELSASIAHEIRNPLTSLKGFLQLMQSSSENVSIYLEIMADEISRIEEITGELLLLAKPQAHDFKKESIERITEHAMVLLHSQALINNVSLIPNFKKTSLVYCVANQIKQVIINIVKNAIESMPNGGDISIILAETEDKVQIIVKDQGCGIPKRFLSEVGLPFYTTKEKGTGLGMMTTLRIVETHGGTVHINSEEGKGTTVEIQLPIKGPA